MVFRSPVVTQTGRPLPECQCRRFNRDRNRRATGNDWINLLMRTFSVSTRYRLMFINLAVVMLWILVGSVSAQQRDDLLADPLAAMHQINPRLPKPLAIDLDKVAAHGIRAQVGKHLTVYTDARDRPDIDELVQVFDLAVSQWCEYFAVEPSRTSAWHMRAFVMEDQLRFKNAGLFPADLPNFPAGYQRGSNIWIFVQPGNYYTRHLLLHEGTHAFMEWFLDGLGTPWYSEGIAEWLGLNQWQSSTINRAAELKINVQVRDRNETPYWGRIKIIRDDWSAGTPLTLQEMLDIPGPAFRDVRYYGWAWAGCEFLAKHPLSAATFREFSRHAGQSESRFNRHVTTGLEQNWDLLAVDWLLFISEMDYGIDVEKIRLVDATEVAAAGPPFRYSIRADRGWQTTALHVKKGDRWRISGIGRYQIGQSIVENQSRPWPCTAHGITMEYYRGRPLGILLAGVWDPTQENPADRIKGLLQPITVGERFEVEIPFNGLLGLRINDSPARMSDNEGALEVLIEKLR